MNPQVFMALSLLSDLQAAATHAVRQKQKGPALLLLYSFIDICASLANADPHKKLPDRFKDYVSRYALTKWSEFSPHDLWAARCSLLHAYSPFGDHTKRPGGTQPLFYYSWPEKRHELESVLRDRGHTGFVLVTIEHIQSIAINSYNGLLIATEQDAAVEATVAANAEQLLRMSEDIRLEDAMAALRSTDQES